eukprot:361399-Chlamydomonas_euryale.AAC.7
MSLVMSKVSSLCCSRTALNASLRSRHSRSDRRASSACGRWRGMESDGLHAGGLTGSHQAEAEGEAGTGARLLVGRPLHQLTDQHTFSAVREAAAQLPLPHMHLPKGAGSVSKPPSPTQRPLHTSPQLNLWSRMQCIRHQIDGTLACHGLDTNFMVLCPVLLLPSALMPFTPHQLSCRSHHTSSHAVHTTPASMPFTPHQLSCRSHHTSFHAARSRPWQPPCHKQL